MLIHINIFYIKKFVKFLVQIKNTKKRTDQMNSNGHKFLIISNNLKSSDLNLNSNNLIFKCLIYGPKEKQVSTSKLSNSNLRTHIR